MLSNLSKSADCLRGSTQTQDLWMEVCEMTPHPGLPGPRQMQNSIMYGKVLDEQEKRETLHRLALKRQQSNNFYLSESAKNVSNNKSSISAAERKAIRTASQHGQRTHRRAPRARWGLGTSR